jgi:ketosteroid isomerase-like protein
MGAKMKTDQLAAPAPSRLPCLLLPRLLSAGNLSAATACFAKDACLLTPDGTAIHERRHIRPLLAQLVARHIRIEVELSNLLLSGDVAFVRERWLLSVAGADGARFEQETDPELVLRQVEGQWKLAIAALWGWGS